MFMKTHDPGGPRLRRPCRLLGEHQRPTTPTPSRVSPGTFTEQVAQRWQAPSYWKSVHTSGSVAVDADEVHHREQRRRDEPVDHQQRQRARTTLQLRATSPYATSGTGSELTGQVNAYNNLTTIYPRLTGDGFTAASGGLNRSVTIAAGATVTAKVVMGFVTNEIPESLTEYNAYAGYSNATAFATHVRAYNLWWAQNVPYIDVARTGDQEEHLLPLVADALQQPRRRHPRADLPVPDLDRGRAGLQQRDRADPADAHRRPQVPAQPGLRLRRLAVSVGQISKGGRFLDNPGDPENWSNSYTQYIAEAAWRSYQIHGGQPAIAGQPRPVRRGRRQGPARLLRPRQQQAHRVRLGRADRQRRRRGVVPLEARATWTAPSRPTQYSGALAAAQAYDGDRQHGQGRPRCARSPTQIQNAIVNVLWNPTGSCSSTGM